MADAAQEDDESQGLTVADAAQEDDESQGLTVADAALKEYWIIKSLLFTILARHWSGERRDHRRQET